MLDLKSIRTITLDIAESYSDGHIQDQAAELILRMLSQNYQIYAFSSNPNHKVAMEEFEHPGLQFLREPMPPAPALAEHLTDLVSQSNLWITDDEDIALWLIERDLPLATRKTPSAAGARRVLRYHGLGELAAALSPTARVMDVVARRLADLVTDGENHSTARVIGIGGPPLAGQPEFALGLKRHLEAEGHALVELLDLTALGLGTIAAAAAAESASSNPFVHGPGRWLLEQFQRIRAGEAVYVEILPEGLPRAFEPHLPLFWSPETVIVAFGEMTLAPPLMAQFDVTVLLENTPYETTRRIYEIEEGNFDPKFTEQYLAHEGTTYERYLEAHHVRERATLRVDSNTPGAYFLVGGEAAASVPVSS